jgi:hypothetical protein
MLDSAIELSQKGKNMYDEITEKLTRHTVPIKLEGLKYIGQPSLSAEIRLEPGRDHRGRFEIWFELKVRLSCGGAKHVINTHGVKEENFSGILVPLEIVLQEMEKEYEEFANDLLRKASLLCRAAASGGEIVFTHVDPGIQISFQHGSAVLDDHWMDFAHFPKGIFAPL